jgi:protoporphyrinogen oxidase
MTQQHWAVVGGGMLGMTLALRLSQRGHKVALLESAPRLGGLASAWRIGNVVWDRFYHVILPSDRHLLCLLDELGLSGDLRWNITRTGFYVEGRWYSLSNALEFLRFPPLGLWDKLRLGLTIWHASRIEDGRPLEQVLARDWLTRWSGRRTYCKIWKPLLQAKLGEASEEVSAAFIWAVIHRLYSARRAGMKREMFGYVRGGYARILDAFLEYLLHWDVEVWTGFRAERVYSQGARLRVESAGGEVQEYDRVVLTTPFPISLALCPELTADERSRLARIRYLGVICASLLVKRPLTGFYVTNLVSPGLPFTGIIEMSALLPPEELAGQGLLYLPKYVSSHDPLFDVPDRDIQKRFLASLSQIVPNFREEDLLACRIARARHVFALPELHYSLRLPSIHTSITGLYLVNSAQIMNGTLNVNETVQLANHAIAQLCPDHPRVARADGEVICNS